MKSIKYRGHIIELIEHKESFRIYRPENEKQTNAYADTLEEAKTVIDDNAWRWESDWQQWIADVYHCSECWGQKMSDEDMRITLEESRQHKNPGDYSPDPSMYKECAAYWNELCDAYPN